MRRCPQCGASYRGAPQHCPLDGEALLAVSDAEAGTQVGEWRIEQTLAEGALATVYRATRGQQVGALKLYKATAPVLRARRESAAQFKLSHPNVAQLLDEGITAMGEAYLVTEFVADAEPLRALLQQQGSGSEGLGWPDAVSIALQVAAGLEAIHAEGLVHRDLKPENIMVSRAGSTPATGVKILDLGHAMALDWGRLTETGQVWGSVPYMSPEQAAGLAVDHRSDLYALGVILYEMLCGKRPFDAAAAADLMQMHWTKMPDPPGPAAAMPQSASDLCLWLLAKRPEQRPASAHVVRAMLAGILATRPGGDGAGAP